MKRLFFAHPKEFNLSYWQHFIFAITIACHCLLAGICLILHAFFPFIFVSTGSNLVFRANRLLEIKSSRIDNQS